MNIDRLRAVRPIAALSVTASLAVSGCMLPNSKQIDYKSVERSSVSTLETPPDIIHPSHSKPAVAAVLAPVSGMHIEHVDDMHWLVVDHQTPEQLWPQLREFWQTQGFKLSVDARERGILETDWKTFRPYLNQGVIRNTLSKVERLGNAYITSQKNKYLTRVVTNTDGRTWISIHHQGQHEVLADVAKEVTQWQPAPNDASLEIEYVQRLMYALAGKGAPEADLQPTQDHQAASAGPPRPIRDSSERAVDVPAQLDLNASFDQIWPQIGLALERANFTIAERDRMKGIYTLRYVEPSEPQIEQKQGGFWRRMFQKRNKDKQAQRYALKVQSLGAATTRISIADEQGEADTSAHARHILQLLAQQLR